MPPKTPPPAEDPGLTLELARRSPAEYVARYQRLHSLERVRYVEALDDDGLIVHIDAFLDGIRRGRRLLRFHVVISPTSAPRFPVRYAVAFEGETYDLQLGELDVTPTRFARLRAWMLARSLEPPWLVVKRRAHDARSLDERLAQAMMLFEGARVVEVVLGLAEPWSERGEAPLGTVALAVRLVEAESVNLLAVLVLDDALSADAFSIEAPRAKRWADTAAARFGVPCEEPTAFTWSRIRS